MTLVIVACGGAGSLKILISLRVVLAGEATGTGIFRLTESLFFGDVPALRTLFLLLTGDAADFVTFLTGCGTLDTLSRVLFGLIAASGALKTVSSALLPSILGLTVGTSGLLSLALYCEEGRAVEIDFQVSLPAHRFQIKEKTYTLYQRKKEVSQRRKDVSNLLHK